MRPDTAGDYFALMKQEWEVKYHRLLAASEVAVGGIDNSKGSMSHSVVAYCRL